MTNQGKLLYSNITYIPTIIIITNNIIPKLNIVVIYYSNIVYILPTGKDDNYFKFYININISLR